jgi:hypothetical protein
MRPMRGSSEAFDLRAALLNELKTAQQALAMPDETTAVHRCRVSIKRARALARVGAEGAPGIADVFNQYARTLMHNLEAARDLAALIGAAERAASDESGKTAKALQALQAALKGQLARIPPTDLQAASRDLSQLTRLAQTWPEPSPAQLQRGAKRILKRAKRAWQRAHDRRKARLRHTWRKREKDRYFVALLAGSAWPEGEKRRRRRTQKLGHALGQERDILLLIERLKDDCHLAGSKRDARLAIDALDGRRRKYARKADRLGQKLHG